MFLSLLDLMRQRGGLPVGEAPALQPHWDEDAAHLILRFRMPGIDPKSVHVQVTESSISVAGSRSHEERVEADGYYRYSSAVGAVARSFRLPVRVVPRLSRVLWTGADELEVRLTKA